MFDEKIPIRRIARTLRICRNTVKRYIKANQLPRREYHLPSGFEEQIPYVKMRLNEHSDIMLKELFAEIQERGY